MTTRRLRKRIKDHAPKSVESFWFSEKKDDIWVIVLNASKCSSIAEHLVINSTCAKSYNLNRFKIVKTCSNVFDLIKLESICILLKKLVLCKQKKFGRKKNLNAHNYVQWIGVEKDISVINPHLHFITIFEQF